MTCKRAPRGHVFCVISPFIAPVAVLIALLGPARLMAGDQPSIKPQDPQLPLFAPAVTYDSGGQLATSIAIGDFNGDGIPDMAVANHSGSVGVLLGKGNGSFQPVVAYDSGGFFSHSIIAADLNNDGKLDLVVADDLCPSLNESCVSVLLGNGDGTFQSPVTYDSGGFPFGSGPGINTPIFVADINGDGKPDVIVANATDRNQVSDGIVGVLLGNGDGTLQPAVHYDSGGFGLSGAALADLNGDGKFDIVVVNCGDPTSCASASVGVLIGNGDGTFQPVKTYGTGGVGSLASPLAIADVNNDGKLDVLVGNQCPQQNGICVGVASIGVLLGNGDGTFQSVITRDIAGNRVNSMAVADLNGDGKQDLALANENGTTVLLGKGDGTFQPQQTYAGGDCCQILVADLNLDGNPDLLNVAGTGAAASVHLGKGDGTFEAGQTFMLGGSEFSWVTVADVNNDGRPDLLAANWCASLCQNQEGAVGVLLNNTVDTNPPVITVSANPKILWPPNGKMLPVTVSGTITDTGSGVNVNSAAYTVKDEYGEVQPKGAITLGPAGNYSFTVLLQASRLGADVNGRRYTVTVQAKDNAGNVGSKTTTVIVPHDQGH